MFVGLKCNYNNITTLPTLPNSLQVLKCNNNLTILPYFPSQLQKVDCGYNKIISLPAINHTITQNTTS